MNIMSLAIREIVKYRKISIFTILVMVVPIGLMVTVGATLHSLSYSNLEDVMMEYGQYHYSVHNISGRQIDQFKIKLETEFDNIGQMKNVEKKSVYIDDVFFYLEEHNDEMDMLKGRQLVVGEYPIGDKEICLSEEDIINGNVQSKLGEKVSVMNADKDIEEYTVTGIVKTGDKYAKWGEPTALVNNLQHSINEDNDNLYYDLYFEIEGVNRYNEFSKNELTLRSILGESSFGESEIEYYKNSRIEVNLREFEASQNQSIIVSSVFFILGITLIMNIFIMSFSNRKKQYGIYGSLGMSKKRMIFLQTLEGLMLNLIALPVGIVLGILLAKSIFPFISKNLFTNNIFVVPNYIIVYSILISSISVLICKMPNIMEISRRSPIKLLNLEKDRRISKFLITLQMKCLREKNIPLYLAVKGAIEMFWSNLTLVIGMVIYLCLIFTLFQFSTEYINSGRFSNANYGGGYDYKVSLKQEGGQLFTQDDINQFLKSEKFEEVSYIVKDSKYSAVLQKDDFLNNGGTNPTVIACSNVLLEELIDSLDVKEMESENWDEKVLVYPNILPDYYMLDQNEARSIQLGDFIEIVNQNDESIMVEVHDVLEQVPAYAWPINTGYSIIMSIDMYSNLNMSYEITEVLLEKKIGIDEGAVESFLNEYTSNNDNSMVHNLNENRNETVSRVNNFVKVTFVFSGILAFLGFLNVMNVTFIKVENSQNYIATLRAIGLSKKKVYRIYNSEIALLTLISTVLSIILSNAIGFLLFNDIGISLWNWVVNYVNWSGYLMISGINLIVLISSAMFLISRSNVMTVSRIEFKQIY